MTLESALSLCLSLSFTLLEMESASEGVPQSAVDRLTSEAEPPEAESSQPESNHPASPEPEVDFENGNIDLDSVLDDPGQIFASMRISLMQQNEDESIRVFEGSFSPSLNTDEAENYENVYTNLLRESLVRFYRYLLNQHSEPTGVRIWLQVNSSFDRVDENGDTQVVSFPMRIALHLYYDDSVSALNAILVPQMTTLVERTIYMTQSGSAWNFRGMESILIHTSLTMNSIDIGAPLRSNRASQRREILFGPNSIFHQTRAKRGFLTRKIANICGADSNCLVVALGIHALKLSRTDVVALNRVQGGLNEFQKRRNRILTAAHQTYNFSGIEFPVTYVNLQRFMSQNKDKIQLNLYGFYRTPGYRNRQSYKIWPYLTSDYSSKGGEIVHLLITHAGNKGGDTRAYHVSYIYDFDDLMNSAHQAFSKTRVRGTFCHTCTARFGSREALESHREFCQSGQSALSFAPITLRKQYIARDKSMPSSLIGFWDLETGILASPSDTFGPRSETRGRLRPVAVSFTYKYLLHPELYKSLLPRSIICETRLINRFLEILHFESFYLQSLIYQQKRSLRRLTSQERLDARRANICSNCHRHFTAVLKPHLHHCHEGSCFCG